LPTPNQDDWNGTDVTVDWVCSDPDGDGICYCSADTFVDTEGAGQDIVGTATDCLDLSAEGHVVLNIDKTDPSVVITSPADEAELVGAVVRVTGTVEDQEGLSGIRELVCNSEAVGIVDGAFTFEASLSMGSNTISCVATDFADNEGGDEIGVTRVSEKTYTFNATEDTNLNSYYPATNYGDEETLQIGDLPDTNHILVKFSQDDIRAAVGSNHVVSAYLELYEESNANNWGSGGYIDVYRMSRVWDEMNASWDCPDADCEDVWSGGYFEDGFSDTLMYQNDELGWKGYDVTSDIQLVQSAYDTYGWLLRKRDFAASGQLDFTSVQGTAGQRPRLIVTVDDQFDPTSTIDSVYPGVVPSDGTTTTVSITGQNLDHVTQAYIDDSPISFTLVDESTLTFDLTYTTPGSHRLSLTSNSLALALDDYVIEADTAAASCPAPAGVTTFSRQGSTLCWRTTPTRLIGYSGDFQLLCRNNWWPGKTSTTISNYFKKAQYTPAFQTYEARGSNYVRILALGTSCRGNGTPSSCCADGSTTGTCNATKETMPFNYGGAGWKIKDLTNDGSGLNATWSGRLENLLRYAEKNGIAVQISLFDENNMSGTNNWANNPWNPNRNDMSAQCDALLTSDAFPDFYDIFESDGTTLNCLGQRQRAYVKSVVSTVKNTNICGATGAGKCRNVIFEVMNEAPYHKDYAGINVNDIKAWHEAVGAWVHAVGGYLVTASVKYNGPQGENPRPCDSTKSDWCMLNACDSTGCASQNGIGNYFNVFKSANINLVTLHWDTWEGNICSRDDKALVFNKPVVFDDDGGEGPDRNQNCTVEDWVQWVTDGSAGECGGGSQPIGKVSFYHTGDGTTVDPDGTPNACKYPDSGEVDCDAWLVEAEGVPMKFCGSSGVQTCDNRVNYCENKGCDDCGDP
jgi:hypothetical protein